MGPRTPDPKGKHNIKDLGGISCLPAKGGKRLQKGGGPRIVVPEASTSDADKKPARNGKDY